MGARVEQKWYQQWESSRRRRHHCRWLGFDKSIIPHLYHRRLLRQLRSVVMFRCLLGLRHSLGGSAVASSTTTAVTLCDDNDNNILDSLPRQFEAIVLLRIGILHWLTLHRPWEHLSKRRLIRVYPPNWAMDLYLDFAVDLPWRK
jgi:hypothetical protein